MNEIIVVCLGFYARARVRIWLIRQSCPYYTCDVTKNSAQLQFQVQRKKLHQCITKRKSVKLLICNVVL